MVAVMYIMYTYFFLSGYYCPTGQSISTPFPCAAGYYCPEGSHAQIHCPSGTYQDQTAQGLCKECVAGYYCDSGEMTPNVNNIYMYLLE
jgi:hypothetical protein